MAVGERIWAKSGIEKPGSGPFLLGGPAYGSLFPSPGLPGVKSSSSLAIATHSPSVSSLACGSPLSLGPPHRLPGWEGVLPGAWSHAVCVGRGAPTRPLLTSPVSPVSQRLQPSEAGAWGSSLLGVMLQAQTLECS